MNSSHKLERDVIAFFSFDPHLSSLPCDHYHHYYHYQASAQYLWLAETLCALGKPDEALAAYDKAILQDHLNVEAIERKKSVACGAWFVAGIVYDKHPALDAEFCASIGKKATAATALHDEGVASDGEKALACFDKAIAAEPEHSNSYFARGRYWFAKQDYEKAQTNLEEAIRLSHLSHEAYHRAASAEHLERAAKFLADNEFDLAITSCTKALDLHRQNRQALKMRAVAYRAKGNVKQAEEDEEAMI